MAKRWLAESYQILAVTPLPGESTLDVQPHPWLPNIYTVPSWTAAWSTRYSTGRPW
jgi:hypothetical protein